MSLTANDVIAHDSRNLEINVWPYVLVLVISATVWLLAWYGDTLSSMVKTWRQSETFAHGFLIVPISVWLIWRRREFVSSLVPRPNYYFLLPLFLAALGWMLGRLAEVIVVQQYCLVVMIVLLVATILGGAIAKVLAFPLLYLLFAVPFGEALLPILMDHTANFTVLALQLTGIPVYREGLYFTVPSGNWSVVEACSGLRYLIASLTLGCLYAYLTYRSFPRRAIFVALSIVVPIVANWIRAYLIVMIGHLSGMKYAVGVDHLIYGWIFFGFVMLLLFWVGSFWREDIESGDDSRSAVRGNVRMTRAAWLNMLAVMPLIAATVAAFPIAAAHLKVDGRDQPRVEVPKHLNNWKPESGTLTDWRPRFINPSARFSQVYSQSEPRVELYVAYYRGQRESSKLISSQNMLVHSSDRVWGSIATSARDLTVNNQKMLVIENQLRGTTSRLMVWHWYWIDGKFTTNHYWAKLLQAKSQLLGRGDDGAAIVVSTIIDSNLEQASRRLRDFVNEVLPVLASNLESTR